MKNIFLLLLLVLFVRGAIGQPNQAEIDKRMKEAQAAIEKMKRDPKMKDFAKSLPNLDSATRSMKAAGKTMDRSHDKSSLASTGQLPEKNDAILRSLPKKLLNKNELTAYLNILKGQLDQQIKSPSVDEARLVSGQPGATAAVLSSTAMVAWYRNDPETAVLLAVKAATLSIDDDASLSNCAAILSLAGLENKAIPLMTALLQRHPGSSTVLNNLGQAYAALGELDTAMYFFGRCVKIAPEHPEANSTAALICVKRGQTELAQQFCTAALKGGLTSEAVHTYQVVFKKDDIENLIDIKPWKSYPFNEHDFTFPLQCERTDDATQVKAELDGYEKKYHDLHEQYKKGYIAELHDKYNALGAIYARNPAQNAGLVNAETIFTRRAGYAYHRISSPLMDDLLDLIKKHGREMFDLTAAYNGKTDTLHHRQDAEGIACGQDNLCQVKLEAKYCLLHTELANEYLPKYAVINNDFVAKRWRLNKELFEAKSQFVRMGIKRGTIQFYGEEATRMEMIFSPLINGEILRDGYKILYRSALCGDRTDLEMKDQAALELKEKACNIDVEIPMGIAKITISCDEFEIEGGELIKAKMNKNFRSGQTTLYAGVGESTSIPGFETSATQYVFVCFDKNNQPVDAGMQGELELDVKSVTKGDQKVILKVGMNTGVNLDPGPMRGLVGVLPYAFR